MQVINFFVGALLLTCTPVATASESVEVRRELWGNANECDVHGNGCPDDRWCDEDGGYVCWRKRSDGERCNRNEKCLSDNCVDWVCAPAADPCLYTTCPVGTYCDLGVCVDNRHCYSDADCLDHEKCENKVCVDPCIYTTCPKGTFCELGICFDNEHCYGDEDCRHNAYCSTDGQCVECYENSHCGYLEKCENYKCVEDDGRCHVDTDCTNNLHCRTTGECAQCFLDIHCSDIGMVCKSYVCVECRYHSHCLYGEVCHDNLCVDSGHCYSDADCFDNEKCQNNLCVISGHCYSDADCPSNKKCQDNICLVHGQCYSDADCATAYCNHLGVCVDCRLDSHCPYGEVCLDHQCIAEAQCTGDHGCGEDEYCNEYGECKPRCYDHRECPVGFWCDTASHICSVILANGAECFHDFQCESGWCKPQAYNANNICAAKKSDGAVCSHDIECQSDFCGDGLCRPILREGDACQDTYECAIGLHCTCAEPHTCVYLKAVGEGCRENCECATDWCVDLYCVARYALGAWCDEDWQCASGHCDNLACGTYFEINHCGSDTCVPVMGAGGDYCTQNYQCTSDLCQGNVCTHATVVDRHGFD